MRPFMFRWNKFDEPEVIFDRKENHILTKKMLIFKQYIIDSNTKTKNIYFINYFRQGFWRDVNETEKSFAHVHFLEEFDFSIFSSFDFNGSRLKSNNLSHWIISLYWILVSV